MENIVVVSGGFDPIHSGHIRLIKAARQLGDRLIVGINSDEWLARKKGRAFMPWQERLAVLNNLKQVDEVYTFDDEDGTACHLLQQVRAHYPDARIIFANGGDRTRENIPEMTVPGVEFVFGVGGSDKANSSSWILQEWKAPRTERAWGYYRVLHEDGKQVKVKELTVEPGQRLSMQRHQDRAEHWFVSQGTATVYTIDRSSDAELLGEFTQHQHIHIDRGEWHQLCNETDQSLRVVEIQYGNACVEEDIERRQ
jgi:D-beta-D-heptose 7-phosphate kinase/D-beta-D-heptose 1-phosphate adenosyltransferase